MSLTIKVEAMAGDTIDQTAKEMRALANRLGVWVVCQFNEVQLNMPPNGSDFSLVFNYHEQRRSLHDSSKVAFG